MGNDPMPGILPLRGQQVMTAVEGIRFRRRLR
jgi:hypothetical protein